MKYIKTFEQFVNESIINESDDQKLFDIIDDLEDDEADITEGENLPAVSLLKGIMSDDKTKVKEAQVKLKADVADMVDIIKDSAKDLEEADDEEKSYFKAILTGMEAYIPVYNAIAKGNPKQVIGAYKKLNSLLQKISNME